MFAARLSRAGESLIFFVIRLLDRLRALGTAPARESPEAAAPGRFRSFPNFVESDAAGKYYGGLVDRAAIVRIQ